MRQNQRILRQARCFTCVCRKPRPFDLTKESRNVGHDGRAAVLRFDADHRQALSFWKILSSADSRDKGESAHHLAR